MAEAQDSIVQQGRAGVRAGDAGAGAAGGGGTVAPPYIGFDAYNTEHQDYLGGRDEDIEIVSTNVQVAALTILHGPTGVGKTSMLRAGVVARLNDSALLPVPEPRIDGVERFAAVYFSNWQCDDFETSLFNICVDVIRRCVDPAWTPSGECTSIDELVTQLPKGIRLLFIFDQFEEYLAVEQSVGERFDRTLARLVNRRDVRANVLIGIREDDLARLDRLHARIPHLLANMLRLAPLDAAQATDALRKPLSAYNKRVAEDQRVAIDPNDDPIPAVVSVAAEADRIEPGFLQVVMRELWDVESARWERHPGEPRLLRHTTLKQTLGGVRAVIDNYVNRTLRKALGSSELVVATAMFDRMVNARGEKVPAHRDVLEKDTRAAFFFTRLADDVVRWRDRRRPVGERRPSRLFTRWSSSLTDTVIDKLRKAQVIRPVAPDRYDIFHQVLARSIESWRLDYEARRRITRIVVLTTLAALVVGVVGGWYIVVRTQQLRAGRFAQYAMDVPANNPRLALTLATYSALQHRTREARETLLAALATADDQFLGHEGMVYSVAFSPSSDRLLSAGADRKVHIWDALSRPDEPPIAFEAHAEGINAVTFCGSPDKALTAGDDNLAYLWQLAATPTEKSTRLVTFDANTADDEIWGAACSPSGNRVVTAGKAGIIRLWDADGTLVKTIPPDPMVPAAESSVVAVAYSRNGRLFATAGFDRRIHLWNAETGDPAGDLRGHTDYVYGLSFAEDAAGRTLLASSSWDRSLRLWNVDESREARPAWLTRSALWGVSFSADGSRVAAASRDGGLFVWDLRTNRQQDYPTPASPVLTAVSFSRDASVIATGTADGAVQLVRLGAPTLPGLDGPLAAVAFARGGDLIAGVVENDRGDRASLWRRDLRTNPIALGAPLGPDDAPTSIALSRAGEVVATGHRDGHVRMWNAAGLAIDDVPAHKGEARAVAVDATGSMVATGGWDNTFTVMTRNAAGRYQLERSPCAHRDPSGPSKKPVECQVWALAFSLDGRELIVGGDKGALLVFDTQSRSVVATLDAAKPVRVLSIDVSNGRRVAAGFIDGSLLVWDLPRRGIAEAPTLAASRVLVGHGNAISGVAFDANGTRLVTASRDQTARVWNVDDRLPFSDDSESGELEVKLPMQRAVVLGARFENFETRQRTVTLAADGSVQVIDYQWEQILESARRLQQPLGEFDCRRYFGRSCPGDIPNTGGRVLTAVERR